MRLRSIDELDCLYQRLESENSTPRSKVSICCGTGCSASGAGDVLAGLSEQMKARNLDTTVSVLSTGCHGFCEKGPLVVISKPVAGQKKTRDIFYQQVKADDVKEIIEQTVLGDGIVERLLYTDPVTNNKVVEESDVPFYRHQKRLLLANNGRIDPTRIDDYLSRGGYRALAKALQLKPDEIMAEITASGLRGRGGGGFPTSRKWTACRKAITKVPHSAMAYILCNADEGDPGAFMDRSLIEGNPHSIIEGMIIGACAICRDTTSTPAGIVYVRNEYPLALKHLRIALDQAREYGLLGDNILGSGFGFDIQLHRGAGAFVCGEETALIASIEGKVGRPTPRPPYPAERGLFNQPTNINNVKTWASVPLIINNGSKWYSRIGTETSKGTMIFSLVGKIANTGLIEVPMGITLREILYKIGGGQAGKKYKVQVGGPSGGFIPEAYLDLPIDYESLLNAGSMMGSGGLIVADESTCMVELARYFLEFCSLESCGKCTPCRIGTTRLQEMLQRLCAGEGKSGDLERIEELAPQVKQNSLCGLGQTAANPVLSTLRHFREEYQAHLEGRCPAKVCTGLITHRILPDKCTGCTVCAKKCPVNAISGRPKEPHAIIAVACTNCGACFRACKFDAVEVI